MVLVIVAVLYDLHMFEPENTPLWKKITDLGLFESGKLLSLQHKWNMILNDFEGN